MAMLVITRWYLYFSLSSLLGNFQPVVLEKQGRCGAARKQCQSDPQRHHVSEQWTGRDGGQKDDMIDIDWLWATMGLPT